MKEPGRATLVGDLVPYGRLAWMEIVRLLDGYVGVWGDLDRMHLEEPLPAEAPAYTHLWAWREGVYARVRLDPTADRHVLGVLVLLGSPLPGGGSPERIDVEVLPVLGWGDDPRVQRLPEQLRCPRLERLVTIQEAAITFVRPVAPGGAT